MYLNNNQVLNNHLAFRFVLPSLLISFSFLALLSLAKPVFAQDSNIHIRTLAASCAACHGTNGNSQSVTPVLAGLDSHYFSTQMLAFKHGDRANSSTVMHHHATGLTEEEIQQLADYFSKQIRTTGTSLTSQTLEKNDE